MKKIRLFEENQNPMTVREIVEVYLENIFCRLKEKDITQEVVDGYVRDLGCFTQQFGSRSVGQCRQHDLTEFLKAHPAWKSVNTKRRNIAAVLACFRWCKEEELIPFCPYASPRALRGMLAESRRPATQEEFATLMRMGSKALRWALLFLYRTGCRTSEMRDLVWEAVRLDGPQAPHLYLTKHKTFRKTQKPRIVGLDPLAVRLLRAIKRIGKGEYVFLNCDGFPWRKDTFCHHIRRLAERIGLDDGVVDRVSAYCLRHTYACDGIEGGFTANQVAHQLGHTSSDMVERVYARHVGQRVGFITDVANGIGKRRGEVK